MGGQGDLRAGDHAGHQVGNDLKDCSDTGLSVQTDGVQLDLNGHTIDGDGAGPDSGIFIDADDVTVKNGTVKQFSQGVAVAGTDGVELVG